MTTGNLNQALEIVSKARKEGVFIFLEDEKIKFRVSKKELVPPALIEEIKKHSREIKILLDNDDFNKKQVNTSQIQVADRSSIPKIPLSFNQERLWFIDQLGGSTAYHVPTVLRLHGAINAA